MITHVLISISSMKSKRLRLYLQKERDKWIQISHTWLI